MKANEAPEKIYKTITYLDERKRGDVKWKDKPVAAAENIEYIRTDAFIEKACNYLTYHLDTSKIDVNYKFDFVEEFTKAMKGE